VWVNGYGWPAYRGGPMYYADSIGLDRIVAKLDEYAPKLGVDAAVSPLLRELAAAGKKFADWKRAA
jgi:3-hydroxyacyl-CoA dehydrogenase